MVTFILIWIILMALVLVFNFGAHYLDDSVYAVENLLVSGDMNKEFVTNHAEMQKIG